MTLEVTNVYKFTCNRCTLEVEIGIRDERPEGWSELHFYRKRTGLPMKELQFHLCETCSDGLEESMDVVVEEISEVQADEDLFDFPATGRLGDNS